MQELRPGLWHWDAPHPGWTPDQPWGERVSSYALDDGGQLLLFDPLSPPGELLDLAARRETMVVLTAPWHERDARSLVERLGVPVCAPRPDTAEDLMRNFGITAEQAGSGSPDLRWLVDGEGEARWYDASAAPPGMRAFEGRVRNDMVLWVESAAAVISGDTLADFGDGLQIVPGWLPKGVTREQVADGLRALLECPVEFVLPTHGAPTDRAALERALA